mmetsp:Transcript_8102/g.17524  ORF Transcript_8102/g.17524 Transcript_8102/m.17524 type:complete len:722 (+) Transcript_8102:591-2756(+)
MSYFCRASTSYPGSIGVVHRSRMGKTLFFNGKMGAAAVRGIQSKGVMATAKHFLANNIENTRFYVSAEMDDKILHEVYLKQWAVIVADSAPEAVMTSYNRVQGHWANQIPKFINILRHRIGFEGWVMTDWWATMHGAMTSQERSPFHGAEGWDWFGNGSVLLTAGVDMEMPMCNFDRRGVRAMASCTMDGGQACQLRNVLDKAVARILRSKIRYGLIGRNVPPKVNPDTFTKVLGRWQRGLSDSGIAALNHLKYQQLALRIARRGMVLLKNENGLLPKPEHDVKTVAVLGTAEFLELGDRGSSDVQHSGEKISVLKGLQIKYSRSKVVHVEDVSTREGSDAVRAADLVVLDIGFDYKDEGEFIPPSIGGDRLFLGLRPDQIQLIKQVSELSSKVVLALTSGQMLVAEEFLPMVQGLIWMGYPGPLGGLALADILAGDVNPSGRLPSATPRRAEDWLPKGITLTPYDGDAEVQYPYAHGFKNMWGAAIKPRFPLGFGLSYTTFAHGQPSLKVVGDSDIPMLELSVEVVNTGKATGSEVVQVYGSCQDCQLARLPVALLGFARTGELPPGEVEVVRLTVSMRELAIYDQEQELWLLEKGHYNIMEGASADQASLGAATFEVGESLTFDYPGSRNGADVKGAGESQCHSFPCKRDEVFLQSQAEAESTAQKLWLAIIGVASVGLLLILCCLCRCFMCQCCRRSCCCCCYGSSSSSSKKQKVKRS